MRCSAGVDPFDMLVTVECNHTVGQCPKDPHEALERLRQRTLLVLAEAHASVQTGKSHFPETISVRQWRIQRAALPVEQFSKMIEVPSEH